MNVDLLARPGRDEARDAPLRASARRQMGRMERLVNNLIDQVQIQNNRFAMRTTRVDLAAVAREAVEDARLASPARTLILDLPAETALPVEADADQPVTVKAWRKGTKVRVMVRDERQVIALANQRRIWERFERVEERHRRSGSKIGLKLGLYLAREIVQRHGGEVGVESAPDEGSPFWFALPLVDAPVAQ